MRNPEQTIGNLIDKQNVSFIASISEEGFPNMKAILNLKILMYRADMEIVLVLTV